MVHFARTMRGLKLLFERARVGNLGNFGGVMGMELMVSPDILQMDFRFGARRQNPTIVEFPYPRCVILNRKNDAGDADAADDNHQ